MEIHVFDCPPRLLAGIKLQVSQPGLGTRQIQVAVDEGFGHAMLAYLEQRKGEPAIPGMTSTLYAVHASLDYPLSNKGEQLFIAFEIEGMQDIPQGLSAWPISSCRCAKFPLAGHPEDSQWLEQAFRKWVGDSGYQRAPGVSLVSYEIRFEGARRIVLSPMEVLIPVEPSSASPRLANGGESAKG